jgi:hypothetical protein
MFCESTPGSILQTATFLRNMKDGRGFSKAALGSIVMSALTTGFGAATMSFE